MPLCLARTWAGITSRSDRSERQAPAGAEFIEDLLREPEVEAADFAGVVAPIDPTD